MWIPCGASIFKYWSHQREITLLLNLLWTFVKMSFKEGQHEVCTMTHTVTLFPETKLGVNCDSKILNRIRKLENHSMNVVAA